MDSRTSNSDDGCRAQPRIWKLWLGLGVLNLVQVLVRLDEFELFDLIFVAASAFLLGSAWFAFRSTRRPV